MGQFAGGSGSAQDPWQIETAEQLDHVRDYLQDNFILIQDIDLGVPPWNEGGGWLGIGQVSGNIFGFDQNEAFNGHFNGNGHTIENLTIVNYAYPGQNGLFAFLGNNAVVENLNITNINLMGMGPIAGLAAFNGGVVRYVMVQGNLEGNQSNIGGIVGVNGGLVRHAIAHVTMVGNTNVGGIAGLNRPGAQIRNSYSSGNIINGMNFLGGLVGKNEGTLSNSYTTGYVNSGSAFYFGEIAGDNTGTISRCFFNLLAYPNPPARDGQGLTNAQMRDPASFESWDFESVWGLQQGITYPFLLQVEGDSPAKTDLIIETIPDYAGNPSGAGSYQYGAFAELMPHPVVGFTFLNWTNEEGEILSDEELFVYRIFNEPQTIYANYEGQFADGTGTVNNPFQIETAQHLYNVRNFIGEEHSDKYFMLVNDIDLFDITREGGAFANPTVSMGDYDAATTYDFGDIVNDDSGNNYVSLQSNNSGNALSNREFWYLSNFYGWEPIGYYVDDPYEVMGFTGRFNGNNKTISGLHINRPADENIGLFGVTEAATIIDLYLTDVDVTGNINVGALIGLSVSPFYGGGDYLENITVEGNITGTYCTWGCSTGGLVGRNEGESSLVSLASLGAVSGWERVGGIFGSLYFSELIDSNSDSAIQGQTFVGGLVGYNASSNILTSFSSGNITGLDWGAGGLVGYNHGSSISDSYSLSNVTGDRTVGGLVGENDGSITNSYSIGAVIGNENVGGLIGVDDGTTSNSYWNIETSGQDTSAGGEGRTTEQMTYPYDAETYVNWDFENIWAHDHDYTVNAGYPHLGEGIPTSIETEEDIPLQVKLHQNYPNPFNPVTTIQYELPQQQEVRLEVFNVLGRRVAVLFSGSQQAGYHSIQFDASRLASGMYLYRLQAGNVVLTQKMMLVK